VLRGLKLVVAAVATVICPNDEGRTPLHIACEHSNVKVNSELMNLGSAGA
jgi:ankyrin repeat protein